MEKVHRHIGQITDINETSYTVKICSLAACASCHLSSQCPSSDKKEKFLDIRREGSPSVELGQEVVVTVSHRSGVFSFVVAYVLPVVLVILAMIILYLTSAPELLSALTLLLIVGVYYTALFFFREKITKQIEIKIE